MYAKQILDKYKNETDHFAYQDYSEERIILAMKEFAKLHVESALLKAGENVVNDIEMIKEYGENMNYKKTIHESYPFINIK